MPSDLINSGDVPWEALPETLGRSPNLTTISLSPLSPVIQGYGPSSPLSHSDYLPLWLPTSGRG